MSLTTEQLAQYKQEGFVALSEFFTADEVAVMQAELERVCQQGLAYNVATDGDGKTPSTSQSNLQICPLSPKSEVFRALPFAAKIRSTVGQLLGDAFMLQLDQIFLKPGGIGAGTGWHQDNHYFASANPEQGLGMWVALNDATVANGTMHIIPGSHTTRREHTRDMGSNHHVTCHVDEEAEEVRPIELPAGGVLFFNYGIAHCTKANQTDKARAGLALHFVQEAHKDAVRAGLADRPVLSGPNYVAGRDVYDRTMEGEWEALVGTRLV
ncbi:MAG: phytanoyl-CoA dioxygenase family protein [Lentisphaerae bacterium]|nr:phytanoyl-CoA dioxygenase family protein [Lentisphaerota bacterium]